MKEFKTNVMRILDQRKIKYSIHEYDNNGIAVDGITVALLTGQDISKVYKTLVTVGTSHSHYVFVIPVQNELNLKKAALSVNEKSVTLVHVKEITPLTGYVRGGCSPIGMKKQYRTIIDDSALELESVSVSAGRIGYQIELAVKDLVSLVHADIASIV